VLSLQLPEDVLLHKALNFEVWNQNFPHRDVLIGQAQLRLDGIVTKSALVGTSIKRTLKLSRKHHAEKGVLTFTIKLQVAKPEAVVEVVEEEVVINPLDDPSNPRLGLAVFVDMEGEKAAKEEARKRKAREQIERDNRAREEEHERYSREVAAMVEEDYRWEAFVEYEQYKKDEALKEPEYYLNERGNRVFIMPGKEPAAEVNYWDDSLYDQVWNDETQSWGFVDKSTGEWVTDTGYDYDYGQYEASATDYAYYDENAAAYEYENATDYYGASY
jgi:hypothetical protein